MSRKAEWMLVVSVAFLAGCVQIDRYRVLELNRTGHVSEEDLLELNALARQGWRVVQVVDDQELLLERL